MARLKQKGVYKAAEHEKLEAERLLVTRQVRFRFVLAPLTEVVLLPVTMVPRVIHREQMTI